MYFKEKQKFEVYPKLETKMYLIWKKYQVFTPIAERLLEMLKAGLSE